MRAVVTGATGFVGRHLLKLLDRPNVLSRDADQARRDLASFNANAFSWNPTTEEPPLAGFDGVDAVFHLAGDPIAEGRWTAAKKQRIRGSRVLGTRASCRLRLENSSAGQACWFPPPRSAATVRGAMRCSTKRRRRPRVFWPTSAWLGNRKPGGLPSLAFA